MNILGIDGATRVCGYAVVSTEAPHYVECGVIRPNGKLPVARRCAIVAACLVELCKEFRIRHAGMEASYIGKGRRTGMTLAALRAVIRDRLHEAGVDVHDWQPKTWRKVACGHGGIKKPGVVDWAVRRFRLRSPPPVDACEALGIAWAEALAPHGRQAHPETSPTFSSVLRWAVDRGLSQVETEAKRQ